MNKINSINNNSVKIKDIINVVNFLSKKIKNDEINKCCYALASLEDKKGEIYIQKLLNNPRFNFSVEEIENKIDYCFKPYYGPKITIKTLFYIANQYGYIPHKKLDNKFWSVVENGKVELNPDRYLNFLDNIGIKNIKRNYSNCLIIESFNIIEEIDIAKIKELVFNYIENYIDLKTASIIKRKLITGQKTYFLRDTFDFLKNYDCSFSKDKKEISCFYYKNGFVSVTKDNVELNEYDILPGKIWKGYINDRNFIGKTEINCDFEKFFNNICNGEAERILSLKTIIGYLLHTYKDKANAKAVIFMDEEYSEFAEGRRGKSLIGDSLRYIRKTVYLDGQNFSFENQFKFQQINQDHQLIIFNDANNKFDYEKLFSLITDDMIINRKHKHEITIPFKDSPKILINTNYSIPIPGGSAKARFIEFPFSNYYSDNFTPSNEFGKTFFDDWDETDWNNFDNFMLECCQLFLKHGILIYKNENSEKNNKINKIGKEFFDFFNSLQLEKKYNRKEIFENFVKENFPNIPLKPNTFTKKLKIYCRLTNLDLISMSSSGKHFFLLTKSQKTKMS